MNLLNSQPGYIQYLGQLTVGNSMRLGNSSGVGTCNQNDGSVTINQLLRVADSNASSEFSAVATYNLSGGGLLNTGRLEVGYGGDTGQYPFMQGTFNLSGSARLMWRTLPDPKIGGGGSTGVFNQHGGTFNCPNRIVEIGTGGGSGVYNYNGGGLNVGGFQLSPTGTFNYLGEPTSISRKSPRATAISMFHPAATRR